MENPRVTIWEAMATHFLDTDTRDCIPTTAMACLRFGLSRSEAYRVWLHEVSPAVGINLWSAAGDWSGWDRDWLVARIETQKDKWLNRWPLLSRVLYPVRFPFMAQTWTAIDECMAVLADVQEPGAQEQLAADLSTLARIFFAALDWGANSPTGERGESRLLTLYPFPFRRIFDPVMSGDEARLADAKLACRLR